MRRAAFLTTLVATILLGLFLGTSEAKPYVMKAGDSLWKVAKVHCGNPALHTVLQRQNKIKNPRRIPIGTTIHLPDTCAIASNSRPQNEETEKQNQTNSVESGAQTSSVGHQSDESMPTTIQEPTAQMGKPNPPTVVACDFRSFLANELSSLNSQDYSSTPNLTEGTSTNAIQVFEIPSATETMGLANSPNRRSSDRCIATIWDDYPCIQPGDVVISKIGDPRFDSVAVLESRLRAALDAGFNVSYDVDEQILELKYGVNWRQGLEADLEKYEEESPQESNYALGENRIYQVSKLRRGVDR